MKTMNNPPLDDHNPSQPPNTNGNGNAHHPSSTSSPNSNSNLPYWQINIPPHLRTATCPPFLLNLSPKDQHTLSIPDAQYTPDSWPTVKTRVAQNKLDEFKRVPSQLRRYLEYNYRLKQDPRYGSVQSFILKERLGWSEQELKPRGARPFECEGDVKILRNDWPYGIDERVVHLVVWTKFALEEEEEGGGLKGEVRGCVDEWVRGRFTRAGGRLNAPGEDCVSFSFGLLVKRRGEGRERKLT